MGEAGRVTLDPRCREEAFVLLSWSQLTEKGLMALHLSRYPHYEPDSRTWATRPTPTSANLSMSRLLRLQLPPDLLRDLSPQLPNRTVFVISNLDKKYRRPVLRPQQSLRDQSLSQRHCLLITMPLPRRRPHDQLRPRNHKQFSCNNHLRRLRFQL